MLNTVPWDVQEKLQKEKEMCAQQQDCANSQIGYANDVCEKQEMHVHRLMRRRMNVETDARKLDRVIDILQRHPEFEELIEVINSGLLY